VKVFVISALVGSVAGSLMTARSIFVPVGRS
jgi:hypothetical protein